MLMIFCNKISSSFNSSTFVIKVSKIVTKAAPLLHGMMTKERMENEICETKKSISAHCQTND